MNMVIIINNESLSIPEILRRIMALLSNGKKMSNIARYGKDTHRVHPRMLYIYSWDTYEKFT